MNIVPDDKSDVLEADTNEHYFCPMHCEGNKVYDKPGNCAICGMHLQKVPPVLSSKDVYTCPMHPEIQMDKPGSCPKCGMALVNVLGKEELIRSSEKLDNKTQETKHSPHTLNKIENSKGGKAGQFTCPMHPEIIKDSPGSCPICGMDLVAINPTSKDEDKTYHELLKKFKISVLFTVPVLLIAMSDMISGNPLLYIMSHNVWNWIQFTLTLPVVFYACWMFFQRAWISIVSWNLNMFTLIGIGSGVAFIFSVIAMLFPDIFPAQFKTESGTVFVYFEATTVILTLILIGQVLEARAHSRTSGAIKALLNLVPAEALLISNGEEKIIPIDQIKKGDHLRVKPGEKIPVDGKLIEGTANIDESMITGEPIPVDKVIGSKLTSGTINSTSSFIMETEKVGSETLLAHIIQMVNDASRSKAPIQKFADRISKYFVPIVIAIAVFTFIVWAIYGPEPRYVFALTNAIAVLIIACPCALGLATPMSIMVGVGRGAQNGVLIKNAEALEKMDKIDTLIIDKTGTITEGKPSVEKVEIEPGYDANEILKQIASLNKYSEHPLAQAVVKYAIDKKVEFLAVQDFKAVSGKGVTGAINGKKVALGNKKLMEEIQTVIPENLLIQVAEAQKSGKTVSFISIDGKAVGYVSITDKIKETSKEAIKGLLEKNIEVFMLTGDNTATAEAVAKELNLTGFKAEFLPADKLAEIKKLQSEGKKVAMAGDGINDAPGLAQADVGIAMGTGTDVAIESAAITLVKGDLQGILKARQLSKDVMRNIRQNLFFAFIYNILGIPLAAGILYPFFGLLLSPMIAAAAMSISSVSVIGNSLRLRNIKI